MSLADAGTSFGLSLMREMNVSTSMVISPFSIAIALSMLRVGARGETKKQIGDVIAKGFTDEQIEREFSSISNKFSKPANGVKTKMANAIFFGNICPINKKYINQLQRQYNALAKNVNFSQPQPACKAINDFVRTATNGEIANVTKPEDITEDTAAFLVNGIYLKADWMNGFEEQKTFEGNFFESDTKSRKVKYLYDSEMDAGFYENENVSVLSLKYKDPSFAFTIFLPAKGYHLSEFVADLSPEFIKCAMTQLKQTAVQVTIPKMKIESSLNMNEVLSKLGLRDLFEFPYPDLSGISDWPLFVSKVLHKAKIEVDEKGTVAAAATSVQMLWLSGRMVLHQFKADRPFLYMLTWNKIPVFIGKHM